jgi:ACS family hexuronate transporter-like MFS transporter
LSLTSIPKSIPPIRTLRTRLVLWTPCVAMLLLSFISLVDRSILGILSPVMLRELHLSASQYGAAILVFSICYMLANPVWGLLMDRVGLFAATGLAVALWSLASGAHALVGGFLGLCLARGLLGFGEGATFPAGLKAVTETLPPEQRSFGLGLAYSGGSLGALLTPIVVVPLALRWGWRSTFVLSATVGFAWIAGWVLLRVSGLYRSGEVVAQMRPAYLEGRPKWNRDLFATAAIYGLGAAPLAFGLYSAPLYLTRILHQPQSALGHLLWIPPAGWETGYLFWGWVADRRRRKALESGNAAISPLGLFASFAAGSTVLCVIPYAAAPPHAVAITMSIFFLVMFLSGGYVVITLAHGATTQAAENTGFLAGFSISGWSLTTGVLMAVVGHMFDRAEYTATFWLVAALPIMGVLSWSILRDPDYNAANPRTTGPAREAL